MSRRWHRIVIVICCLLSFCAVALQFYDALVSTMPFNRAEAQFWEAYRRGDAEGERRAIAAECVAMSHGVLRVISDTCKDYLP